MSHAYFITGTDTGVGKTLCSAALLRAARGRGLRVVGMKPVASGCEVTPDGLRNEDALALQAESSAPVPAYAEINPYAFEPAIAPHVAAREAGAFIDFGAIRARWDRLRAVADFAVMEGAGGWQVPLDGRRSFPDLVTTLKLPVVLVVGLRLGCLNHAQLSAESILARGLKLAGWIGSGIDPQFARLEDNLETLRARLPAPCLGIIPPLAAPDLPTRIGEAAARLDLAALGLPATAR